jgi:hypothetical protein
MMSRKSSCSVACPSRSYEATPIRAILHYQMGNLTATNSVVFQTLYHHVSNSKLCCDFSNHHSSIMSDEDTNFLFTALFSAGNSWSTGTKQTGYVCDFLDISPSATWCRHPCRHIHTHDEVHRQCLQWNHSTLHEITANKQNKISQTSYCSGPRVYYSTHAPDSYFNHVIPYSQYRCKACKTTLLTTFGMTFITMGTRDPWIVMTQADCDADHHVWCPAQTEDLFFATMPIAGSGAHSIF